MGLAGCPARQPARPWWHRVPKAPLVLVFSFRLPQPSLGQVAFSIFSPLASLSMEGNTGERSRFSHNAAASLQSNVALTIRQGIAFIRVYSNRAWARKSSEPVGSSEQGVFDRVPFTDFLRSSGDRKSTRLNSSHGYIS